MANDSLTERIRTGNYALCFNASCPDGARCLRAMLARHNSADIPRITVVNPLAYPQEGGACPFFRPDEKVRMAWGLKHLYDDMPARVSRAVHAHLEAHFRHTTYYHYRNGKLPLTPGLQAYIRQVCLLHGWEQEPVFDRYSEEYDW